MGSLTHVCVWDNHRWIQVTADEAAKMHPGGTVSANSRIFICELCGQGVTFTNGPVRERYFRHSRGEDDKSCPERTHGKDYQPAIFQAGDHSLPLRVRQNGNSGYYKFEIGFIRVPSALLHLADNKTITIAADAAKNSFHYDFDRLEEDKITYLDVGNVPATSYSVTVDTALRSYWPHCVDGIDEPGALFDERTGRLLVRDSDISAHHSYLFFTKESLDLGALFCGIQYTPLKSCGRWNVYSIRVTEYSGDAAKFFLQYHYRLTGSPIYIQPVWPLYRKTPYLIEHNRDFLYLYINGDLRENTPGRPVTKVFPSADYVRQKPCYDGNGRPQGSILHVQCNERQQIISIGRTDVLQFTYFWKMPLSEVTKPPVCKITDCHGKNMAGGICSSLPERQILLVTPSYDGEAVIRKKEKLYEKRALKAGQTTEFSVAFGMDIAILQGLDVVYSISFQHPTIAADSEKVWIAKLNHCSGYKMKFTEVSGRMMAELMRGPEMKKWLERQRQLGYIREDALKLLKYYSVHGRQHA